MQYQRSRSASRRKGAALVEFAIVLPIILLCLSSMLEFSRVLMLQHTADSAAYEAARSAMVPGATAQDAIDAANELLTANRLRSTKITVTPSVITEETALITVLVEIPVPSNSWLPPFWFQSTVVRSEVTLFSERPPIVQLTGVPGLKAKKQTSKNNSVGL